VLCELCESVLALGSFKSWGVAGVKVRAVECESVISPTHKRTEGRAQVLGSEFTSNAAKLQGGSSRNGCYAELKFMFWVLPGWWWCSRATAF
jgi:hypothetical protein